MSAWHGPLHSELQAAGITTLSLAQSLKGEPIWETPHAVIICWVNIEARQRMIAQYAIAGACQGLVVGTDQAAQALMGFFTKFGDGAADIVPLAGLNKRRVRAIASYLAAPHRLVGPVPTADLEDLRPLRPDEEAYGVTYEQIDDYLDGVSIDPAAERRIAQEYERSRTSGRRQSHRPRSIVPH